MSKFETWMQKHYKSKTYIRILKSHLRNDYNTYANSCQNIQLANEIRQKLYYIDTINDKQGDVYRSLRTLGNFLVMGQDFNRNVFEKKQKSSMSSYLLRAMKQYEKYNNVGKKSLVLRVIFLKSRGHTDATSKEYSLNFSKTGYDRNGHKHRANHKFACYEYNELTFVNVCGLHTNNDIVRYIKEHID